jgi:hypothetical protein
MDKRISESDIKIIQTKTNEFRTIYDSSISLEENLVKYYLHEFPGSFPEEAYDVVKGLKNGILKFNENLKKAIESGSFDYKEEMKNISEGMDNNQRFELYVNFLAALNALNIDNIAENSTDLTAEYHSIKEYYNVNGDVPDSMLTDIETKIEEALKNNTLCLGSFEDLKDLISSSNRSNDDFNEEILNRQNDLKDKLIASMTTYVLSLNNEIDSLKGQNVTPESVAILVSAGIEESRVMQDLQEGETTIDKAIAMLKIIGGIALFTILSTMCAIVAYQLIASLLTFLITTFGATALLTIGAASLICFFAPDLIKLGERVIKKSKEWLSQICDTTVEVWRSRNSSAINELAKESEEWISSLMQNNILCIEVTDPKIMILNK